MNKHNPENSTTLVFIPGSLCDEALFAPQLTYFQTDYSVLIADISQGQSIQELALSVLEQAPEQFVLIGFSMGGVIALDIMRRCPERVLKLVLMNTSPLGDTDAKRQTRLTEIEQVAQTGPDGALAFCRQHLLPLYFAAPAAESVKNTVVTMTERGGNPAFEQHWLALNSRTDSVNSLADISCPTLVMWGEHDQLCPQDKQQIMLERIPNISEVMIEKAGHFSPLEQANTVNQALAHWLKG